MAHPERHDVAVVGAGIAGLSACVLLRRAGLTVVCLDALPHPHSKVGESLDWSSPGLLGRVGIDVNSPLADEIATYKKHIAVYEIGHPAWTATPPPIIRRSPLRFGTVTLHVDRTALDSRLHDQAKLLGTAFVWDRVTTVTTVGDRATGCSTAAGRRVEASWYIDASGAARIFSRTMGISIAAYGRQKVCLWTYFDTPPLHDGTAFFVDNRDAYLAWVWDIPISPRQTSVGFVLPADAVRDRRRAGASVYTILREELARHPRRRLYSQHVFRLGHAFNAHIEKTVYGHPVRWAFGLKTATYVYTSFAFFMNALHARVDPRGAAGMAVFSVLFAGALAWIGGWMLMARAVLMCRRPRLDGDW